MLERGKGVAVWRQIEQQIADDIARGVFAEGSRLPTEPALAERFGVNRHTLRRAMRDENMRKIDAWTARYRLARLDWPVEPVDPFFNANRPEDLAEAERLLG